LFGIVIIDRKTAVISRVAKQ